MKIQISKYDIIWNYLGIFINLFGNFIILPFLLFFLDDNTYGLWNVFISIGGGVTLFDFGFNVTFARNITYCWSGASVLYGDSVAYSKNSNTDFYLMKKVLVTCKMVYFIISIVAIFLLSLLGSIYIIHISSELNQVTTIVAWAIYVVAIFLNLYYGYYDSFLRGVGAIAEVNKLKVLSRLIHIIVVIVTLYWGFGIIGASLGYLIYGVIFRVTAKHKFYNFKDIGNGIKNIKLLEPRKEIGEMFSIIWNNAWRDGIVQTADFLSNQLIVVIASLYLSLSATGAYSLMVQLSQAVIMIAGASYNAYQPTLQSAYVKRDTEQVKNIMSAILVSYVTISFVGFVGLVYVIVPLLRIINPTMVLERIVLSFIWLYHFLLKGRNCYTSYLASTNRIIYAKSFLFSGIVTVILVVLFEIFLHLDILGIVLAQILGQLIYNIWYWPKKVHAEIGLKIKEVIPRGVRELVRLVRL